MCTSLYYIFKWHICVAYFTALHLHDICILCILHCNRNVTLGGDSMMFMMMNIRTEARHCWRTLTHLSHVMATSQALNYDAIFVTEKQN